MRKEARVLGMTLALVVAIAGCGGGGGGGDKIGPQLMQAAATSATTVLLTFTEEMAADAGDPAHYSIAPGIVVTGAQQSAFGTQVLLTTLPMSAAASYTVTASNVTDDRGNPIDPNADSATFVLPPADNVPPEIMRVVTTSPTTILVSFSEPMDPRAGDSVHYTLLPGGTVIDAELNSFKTQVVLNVLPLTPGVPYTITLGGITDEVGNAIASSSASVVTTTPPSDSTLPRMTAAVATSATTILVSFSEPMHEMAADPARFALSPVGDVVGAELTRFGTQVLLTTLPLPPGALLTLSAPTVIDATGNPLQANGNSINLVFGSVVDTRAPQMMSAVIFNATTIQLTFSEPLAATAADPTLYSLSPPVTILNAELSNQSNQVVLTTAPLQDGVQYSISIVGVVKDPAGNAVDVQAPPFTVKPADGSQSPAELLPRVVGAASTSNTTVIIKFSEGMSNTALNPANYFIELEPNVGVLTLANRCTEGEHEGDLCSSGGVPLMVCGGNGPKRGQICRSANDCGTGVACEDSCSGDICVGARFVGTDRTEVELQTISQNDGIYTVTVTGATDLGGNPLAPKQVSGGVSFDPTSAVFPGTGPVADGGIDGNAGVDSDGDAMPDTDEQSGWDVTITFLNGQQSTQHQTANPLYADTDGDGLIDSLEFSIGTNPRSNDTEGDGLTDYEEWNITFTETTKQDTDDDGIGDVPEMEYFKTNPLIEDSDGDGFTDSQELFELNRNPRIADLPKHQITVGDVSLQIDERYSFTDEEGVVQSETSSTNTTLSQGSETSQSKSDTQTHTFMATAGVRGGISDQEGATLFIQGNLELSTNNEWTWGSESSSSFSAQQAYESSLEKGFELTSSSSVTREVEGASISATVSLQNVGDVAFSLKNVEVSVLAPDPVDRRKFLPIATLIPQTTLTTGEPAVFNLGPLDPARGPIIFSSRDAFPNLVEDLMRNPRGLMFRVVNFDLVDEFERNFAFASQVARDRTAGIVVDYGDGTVERFLVVTTATFDKPREEGGVLIGGFDDDGLSLGIPLDFALQDILRLEKNGTANDAIVAGPNGSAQSVAQGDDVQLILPGIDGLPEDTIVVAAGDDGVLDTTPAAGDLAAVTGGYTTSSTCGADTASAIIEPRTGGEGKADTDKDPASDDVQATPTRLAPGTVIIAAGTNLLIETATASDDIFVGPGISCSTNADCEVGGQTGTCDATSHTCGDDTVRAIIEPRSGGNGKADTVADSTSDDVQQTPTRLAPGTVIIAAGANLFADTAGSGDDIYIGPGIPCTNNDDCKVGDQVGTCTGREALVRFKHRRRGDFGRFWTVITSDGRQIGRDFGKIQLRPGDTLGLAFVQDTDRDGVIAQQEYLYSSSDKLQDSDGDELDDFAEIITGWDVGVRDGRPIRKVFSDPRQFDSDRDGLGDKEEQDLRRLQCQCVGGPTPRASCTSNAVCSVEMNAGACRDTLDCVPSDMNQCPACPTDAIRTDPRLRDTDGDNVDDVDEVLGFLSGAGIVDPDRVIIAGDRKADTLACPNLKCVGGANADKSCRRDRECPGGSCSRAGCDDVQVIPVGTAGIDPRSVVVAPGVDGVLTTTSLTGDTTVTSGNLRADTRAVADDKQFAAPGAMIAAGGVVVKPGPDGIMQTLPTGPPAGDDVRLLGSVYKITSALDPDTDGDLVPDGIERLLGSDPTDPLDSGNFADKDRDGLTDAEETLFGWGVTVVDINGVAVSRMVFSNPNVPDTDLDGLPDFLENQLRTDPTRADTDNDGLDDYDEFAQFEIYAAYEDFFPGFSLDGSQSKAYGTDPIKVDTDDDTLSDRDELLIPYRVAVPGEGAVRTGFTNPLLLDSDSDAASDAVELVRKTDPLAPDTDGDRRLDGDEITKMTDPLVPDISVTVRFVHLRITNGPSSNTDNANSRLWKWDFSVRQSSGAFATAATLPEVGDNNALTCEIGSPYADTCGNACSGIGNRSTVTFLQADPVAFALRARQGFTINGDVIQKSDSSCNGSESRVNCAMGFSETFTFESLSMSGFAVKTQTLNNAGCALTVTYQIQVE